MSQFKIELSITHEQICDLLCTAFEGGSNYWIENGRVELIEPSYDSIPKENVIWYGIPSVYEGEFKITIDVPDDQLYTLDNEAVKRGLDVMSKKYSSHMSDLINDDVDADTADVFLQCCLFGQLVYG